MGTYSQHFLTKDCDFVISPLWRLAGVGGAEIYLLVGGENLRQQERQGTGLVVVAEIELKVVEVMEVAGVEVVVVVQET